MILNICMWIITISGTIVTAGLAALIIMAIIFIAQDWLFNR